MTTKSLNIYRVINIEKHMFDIKNQHYML